MRSTARGAVSLERLTVNADGDRLYTFTHPWSDGTTGITRSPRAWLEQRAALVPLPRQHLLRYGGCLAPHSTWRAAIIPTPRQQGVEEPAGSTASPHWTWAPWLTRVFAMDMAHCPVCQQGRLRLIAAITDRSVIMNMLRHLQRAVDPPPIAPAPQAACAWACSSPWRSQGGGAPAAVGLWVTRCPCPHLYEPPLSSLVRHRRGRFPRAVVHLRPSTPANGLTAGRLVYYKVVWSSPGACASSASRAHGTRSAAARGGEKGLWNSYPPPSRVCVGLLQPVTCSPGRRASAARHVPALRAPALRLWAHRHPCAAATPSGRL